MIWIPPAMMSVVAVLLVINALRFRGNKEETDDAAALAVLASSWTG